MSRESLPVVPLPKTLLSSGLLLVAGGTSLVSQETTAVDGPDPIKIVRKREKLTIPEVARDEVIGFALYTVHGGTMKMGVQLYPLAEGEAREVELHVDRGDGWSKVGTAEVDEPGWHAAFRIEGWDSSKDVPYKVAHPGGATYEGIVRKDPVDKDEIVVAGFTGNSNQDRGPRTDIVENIKKLDPDLLFFSGDQSYDHKSHTAAWLLFGRQFGEVMKDRPTVAIPDDHDVGQGNLWGEGGKVSTAKGGSDGGYIMPADYVRMVEKAQTSHLPDPFDPEPIQQGIGVYFTSLNIGGIGFAVIEDRKFKTGPLGLIPEMGPRPDHINDPSYDRRTVDVPEARLLGERQLRFLDAWGEDWAGQEMKCVLSQTIFAGGAHIHGKHDGRLLADLDSNGWPQTGRNRALYAMRRSFAFHLAGDQHLATVIHHGTQHWEDSSFSFCVPSIVNYYGRWWWPLEDPVEGGPEAEGLRFGGRYFDGLGNKVSMHAYANPTTENHNAAGFGIVRFKKSDRSITMECWPRHIDVDAPDASQFPGWPVAINQLDNYSRTPYGHLPEIVISGADDPVVQVVDEYLNEVVYTLRINGNAFRPPVFREASYTLRVGEGDGAKVFTGLIPSTEGEGEKLEVSL